MENLRNFLIIRMDFLGKPYGFFGKIYNELYTPKRNFRYKLTSARGILDTNHKRTRGILDTFYRRLGILDTFIILEFFYNKNLSAVCMFLGEVYHGVLF